MFDVLVIGKGLFGSAAGRYLSQEDVDVALVGPDEPTGSWQEHRGVFASYYDQGRITRALDSTKIWADLAMKSIREYQAIEAASGISFYHSCGGIQIGPPSDAKDPYMVNTESVAQELGTNYERYTGAEFRSVHPELSIYDDYTVLHEPTLAGYINPRSLVEAQSAVAQQQGATIISETVTSLSLIPNGVCVKTDGGQEIKAKHVLVTAGAWTQFLLEQDLGMVLNPRTIALAKVSSAEAARLQNLPSVIFYAGMKNPLLTGVYMLPPIRYPNGEMYVKIGGRLKDMQIPQSPAELMDWFHSDGSKVEAEAIESEMFSLIPELNAESITARPCVVTQTANKAPLFEEVEPGRIFVVAGGCGAGAKSSNEIGRLGAEMIQQFMQSKDS